MSDPIEYGSAEHAAQEALWQSKAAYEGHINADVPWVAAIVVAGLRERGFVVTRDPRCECGWKGDGNHYHDDRLGRTPTSTGEGGAL